MDRFVLPPGFRFHPTDEELVSHYLKRKICGRKFDFDAIGEVDLYNHEPWDLPEKSFLQTRDLEWYFFIPRDRKYPNGSRTNRATEKGYWKSTGKDRAITSGSRNVGTKKTLVYYNGRAPKGERTNWVMHEYRLNDAECHRVNVLENGFVLCRIYQKSGAGPKNGEQYGAPVEDEEFDSVSPAGGDGSGSFKAGMSGAGPSNANGHYDSSPTIDCTSEAVSHEDNKVHPSFTKACIQPRSLKFEDSPGTITSDFVHDGIRRSALPGYGAEASGALASFEEDDVFRDLCMPLRSNACADQFISTEGDQGHTTLVESGFYQLGAFPPSDGDFLEMNDLLPVSENGMEEQTNVRWKEFSNESECTTATQMQAVSAFQNMPQDYSGQWQDLEDSPEAVHMPSSMPAVTYDSQHQPFRESLESLIASSGLLDEEFGEACQTETADPDLEEVLEFFARAEADKSFNVESYAENLQKELPPSEENLTLPSEEGHFYDAVLLFPETNLYGESRTAAGQTSSNFGESQMTALTQATLASNMDGVLDNLTIDRIVKTELPEGVVESHDFTAESGLILEGEEITLGQVKHPPSPLSILWGVLDSLPTLPASAADLSPKAITSEVKNAGRFVKSLSFSRQRSKPTGDKWKIGYYISALFAAFAAISWLLIAGGEWRLFGGLYRKMVGSET